MFIFIFATFAAFLTSFYSYVHYISVF